MLAEIADVEILSRGLGYELRGAEAAAVLPDVLT